MATAVSLSLHKGEEENIGDPTATVTVGTSAPGAGDIELRIGTGIANLYQVQNALRMFEAWLSRYPGGTAMGGATTLPGV